MDRAQFPHENVLFSGSRSKVLRAQQFIAELEAELADYVSSKPITAEIVSGNLVKFTKAGITLKPACIVGDAVHNLRAALDLMACSLAILRGETDDEVYFPFANSADEIDGRVRKRFSKAGEDACVLVKTFKPYVGGNAALRGLHDLDVRDKHTGIIIGTSQLNATVRGSLHLDVIAKPTVWADLDELRYVFSDDTPFAGRAVVETLKELVQLVEGILEAFAALVAARAQP